MTGNILRDFFVITVSRCLIEYWECFLDFPIVRLVQKIVMSLFYMSQLGTIYLGLFIFFAGIIGNIGNIIIFASVRNYRTNASTFYYLVDSIQNIFLLVIDVGLRVLSDGFELEFGRNSNVWCKARRFFSVTFGFISLVYACLATINQFFATSPNVRLRNWSNIKWAHRAVVLVIIICCLHGIPYLVFANISPTSGVCVITNVAFQVYVPLFIVVVLTFIVSTLR